MMNDEQKSKQRELNAILSNVRHKGIVYLDCEWNNQCKILALTYCYDDLIPHIILDTGDMKLFIESHKEYLWVGHNIKSDLLIILENFGYIHNKVFDTMIAAQVATNGKKETKVVPKFYTYGNTVKLICNVELDKSHQVSFLKMESIDESNTELIDYIKNDVIYLKPIKEKLEGMLKKHKKAFNLDMKVLPILVGIENRGMLADVKALQKINKKWEEKANDIKENLFEILEDLGIPRFTTKIKELKTKTNYIESELNFNSHIQVKDVFRKLDIVLPTDKEGKETTNKDMLLEFITKNPTMDNKLIKLISTFIDYKIIQKLITSWGSKLIARLKDGNIIATDYTIAFTTTGRLSSKGNDIRSWTTNLQNIPAKTQEGKDIMKCLIARRGYKIVASDMEGAELRIAAALSKDELLMDSFNKGVDFHSELATCSWEHISSYKNIEFKPVNKKYPMIDGTSFRDIHKGVNFSILYGGEAPRLSQLLNIPLDIAKKCFMSIKNKVPILMGYLEGNYHKFKKDGYLQNKITGRVRYNLSKTEAFNWEIQNNNAEAMKVALILMDRHIKKNKIDAHILNTVHDSIVLEVSENHIIFDEHLFIEDIMAKSLGLFLDGVKGSADMNVASYWKK